MPWTWCLIGRCCLVSWHTIRSLHYKAGWDKSFMPGWIGQILYALTCTVQKLRLTSKLAQTQVGLSTPVCSDKSPWPWRNDHKTVTTCTLIVRQACATVTVTVTVTEYADFSRGSPKRVRNAVTAMATHWRGLEPRLRASKPWSRTFEAQSPPLPLHPLPVRACMFRVDSEPSSFSVPLVKIHHMLQ